MKFFLDLRYVCSTYVLCMYYVCSVYVWMHVVYVRVCIEGGKSQYLGGGGEENKTMFLSPLLSSSCDKHLNTRLIN